MRYTTDTIPASIQHEILDAANAAVRFFVFKKYPSTFSSVEIEDIVGNTVYKAVKYIDKYDPNRKLFSYIGQIARNCVIDSLDYKKKRLPLSDALFIEDEDGEEFERVEFGTYRGDEFEADRNLLLNEFLEEIDDFENSLSNTERVHFEMMLEGCKPAEMAAKNGGTPNAAAIRSYNLRKQYREFRQAA